MKIKIVPDDLYVYIMRDIQGARFEAFAKLVFFSIFGEKFIPLGGIHDGGADGAISSFIQEVEGSPTTFVQFSATDASGAKTKIRDTINALLKAGRAPAQVIYGTSEAIPKADLIVSDLFKETKVLVQIRDVERIKNYVNTDQKANHDFYECFSDKINSLVKIANLDNPVVSNYALDPTVYVFLNHELRDRFSKDKINNKVLDALIYWVLRETDPDKKILVSRSELAATILEKFPTAKSILLPNLDSQLEELRKKDSAGNERLRYYKPTDSFSLPFEMRQTLAAEAAAMLGQQVRFQTSITERISRLHAKVDDKILDTCVKLVFATIHRYFVDQGMILGAFLEKHIEKIHLSDQIVEDCMVQCLAILESKSKISPELFGTCMATVRGIFYTSTQDEQIYLSYLSRTSCLLVTLQSAPKLLEYLNQMGGNFRLLVGTDMLVKALSENYLDNVQKQVTNLLLICKKMGSHLILTEPVLEEVFTHLHAAHLEFENHYAAQEQYLKTNHIAECDRILIRAYLYAHRMPKGGPTSWGNFVNQFTDPIGLKARTVVARNSLKGFLVQRFGMEFMSTDDLMSTVSHAKVNALADTLEQARGTAKHHDLSKNDSLMVHATYAQRRINKEEGKYDGFGFRTWWLTKETRIVSMTGELVKSEGGIPYVMRPEFLLNFVTLAPKASTVRASFADFLPTTAGLQLGRYLDSAEMHKILSDVGEWSNLPPERVSVLLDENVNKLKHDKYKQYTNNIALAR